jgi:hypothetical protein
VRQARKFYRAAITKRLFISLAVFIIVSLQTYNLQATHYYVDKRGNDNANGTSWKTALATIKRAVDKTSDSTNDIIDVNSGEYTTGPITLKSKLTLNFRAFVTVSAEPGAFGLYDPLFRSLDKSDITFNGDKTIFQMNKEEYTSGEDRMVILLNGCSNIEINDLTLKDSGGDGIYLGTNGYRNNQNVIIRNVICDNNKRNGISIISANDLLIDNCILKNTNGTPPEAGIDIEPNHHYEDLNDITISNTIIYNNNRSGILIDLQNLYSNPESPNDVKIKVENVYVTNNKNRGIGVYSIRDDCADGKIEFNNVTATKSERILTVEKSCRKIDLKFNNCVFLDSGNNPIQILDRDELFVNAGRIDFNDCQVFDNANRPAVIYIGDSTDTLYNVTGKLYVKNDKRTSNLYDWGGANTRNVTINLISGALNWTNAYIARNFTWYSSIFAAIMSANDSDVILVSPATHNEQAHFYGKAITISSFDPNDWGVVGATIINANGSNQGVLFDFGEDSDSILEGLTVKGGTYGIKCSGAGPTIRKCVITGNSSHGVYYQGNLPQAQSEILNCKIYQNSGDGVNSAANKAPNIKNCLIYKNSNGIKTSYPTNTYQIYNNTIVYNTNKGIYRSGGGNYDIGNCILWGNGDDLYNCSATYSCIKNNDAGTGNIHSDPYFVNAANDDYHIKSISPCIDKGEPNGNYSGQVDIDGDVRAVDDNYDAAIRVDIGADEAVFCPPIWNYATQCSGDCSGSGGIPDSRVNAYDLAILNKYKNSIYGDGKYSPAADFDRDGDVDNDDYNILVAHWGKQVSSSCATGGTWPPVE